MADPKPKQPPKPIRALSVIPDGDGWSLLVWTIADGKATSKKVHERDARSICQAKAMRLLQEDA